MHGHILSRCVFSGSKCVSRIQVNNQGFSKFSGHQLIEKASLTNVGVKMGVKMPNSGCQGKLWRTGHTCSMSILPDMMVLQNTNIVLLHGIKYSIFATFSYPSCISVIIHFPSLTVHEDYRKQVSGKYWYTRD